MPGRTAFRPAASASPGRTALARGMFSAHPWGTYSVFLAEELPAPQRGSARFAAVPVTPPHPRKGRSMRTATGLTVIAFGAILAFAVTATTPLVNVQVVGWVLIVTGALGMAIPKKGYGWLRRRLVLRPGPRGPVVSRVDETRYPRSIIRYPDATPTADDEPGSRGWRPGGWLADRDDPLRRRANSETAIREPTMPGDTETIEEFTQE